MSKYNVDLDKEENKIYFDIEDEYNNLMDKWNSINLNITKLKIPRLFLWKTKSKLKNIASSILGLQKEYFVWQEKAYKFYTKPNFIIDSDANKELIVMRCLNYLNNLINKMNYDMKMIADNYNSEIVNIKIK